MTVLETRSGVWKNVKGRVKGVVGGRVTVREGNREGGRVKEMEDDREGG